MDVFPPLEAAMATFRGFLLREGLANAIRWIWRDNVYTRRAPGSYRSWRRPIYLNLDGTADTSLVGRYYRWGVGRKLGIALCVFCVADGQPCCYVYLPEDETDAEYRMMTSLKYQIPSPVPVATIVANPLRRWLLRTFVGTSDNPWLNDLPKRVCAERL
jgi:hypothetical protein